MKINDIPNALLAFVKRRPLIAGVILLSALGGVFMILRGDETVDGNAYYAVKRGDFLVSIVEGGNLEAVTETVIRNELDGTSRIIYIVPEGSFVKKGDLVVELDSAEADDQLNQQQIAYEKSVAEHVAAENNLVIMNSTVDSEVRTAELNRLFAMMDLEKFNEIEKDQEVRNAEIEIITAEEALKLAEEKLAWSEKLAAKGFESKSNLDRDRLTVTNQSLGLEKAKSLQTMLKSFDLEKLHATYKSALEEAEQELIRVKKQGESKLAQAQADVNSAKATLDLNQSKLEKMKVQYEATKIYAPQDGLVVYAEQNSRFSSESFIEEGAQVRQRQELIKLPDTSRMKVTVKVHESHVGQVQEGMPAFVVLDSIPDQRFSGTVAKVAILPDAGSRFGNPNLKVYSTEIIINDELPNVKPGVSARAEIVITNLKDVLTVPIYTVTTERGKQVCYVKSITGPKSVPVVVGLYNTKLIEIREGLKEGDLVLLAPPVETGDSDLDGSVLDDQGEEGLELPSERPEEKVRTLPGAPPGEGPGEGPGAAPKGPEEGRGRPGGGGANGQGGGGARNRGGGGGDEGGGPRNRGAQGGSGQGGRRNGGDGGSGRGQ